MNRIYTEGMQITMPITLATPSTRERVRLRSPLRRIFVPSSLVAAALSLASCASNGKTSDMSTTSKPPSHAPGSSASAAAAQGALFFDDGGPQGTMPVVFLHASGGSTAHFAAQLAHLRSTRRAIAIDLPGHGRSPRASSFEVADVAEVALAALTAHGVERFVLAGHSWGGAVALAMAGQAPERVAALLLIDPASDGHLMPKEEADGLMEALRTNYDAVLDAHWSSLLVGASAEGKARLMREIKAEPREVITGTLASLLTFDPLPSLARYHGPRRSLITPLNDRPDAYHQLSKELPATKIEGTGHWPQLDKPAEVNAAIDAFLEEAEASRAEPPRL